MLGDEDGGGLAGVGDADADAEVTVPGRRRSQLESSLRRLGTALPPGQNHRFGMLDDEHVDLALTGGLGTHAPEMRPILGGSKPEQLTTALDAMELNLPSEIREQLDAAR